MFTLPKTKVDWFDEIGSLTGIVGAFLISSNIGMEGAAYIIFLLSVMCFIYVGHVKGLNGIRRMNIVFLFINLWGIWRWLIQPWLGL